MTISAGLLVFCKKQKRVLLAHPGGPYFAKKDNGWWTFPKGEVHPQESTLAAAFREFSEETGISITGIAIALPTVHLKSGKRIVAYALESQTCFPVESANLFELEWPPKSGKKMLFPEIDRCEWFTLAAAKDKIMPALLPQLQAVEETMLAE